MWLFTLRITPTPRTSQSSLRSATRARGLGAMEIRGLQQPRKDVSRHLVDSCSKQCPRQEQKRDAEIDDDPRDIDERRYEGRRGGSRIEMERFHYQR